MKLNLALKIETPPKPIVDSFANEKKFSKDLEYSNSCCLVIMENHIEESIYVSIPKLKNANDFLNVITKKYTKFSKNGKNKLFDNHYVNVCFESNVIGVPFDTWWLDSGTTIHVCNSSRRSPTNLEQYVYMRDGTRVKVDFLGVVKLQLCTRFFFFWNCRMWRTYP